MNSCRRLGKNPATAPNIRLPSACACPPASRTLQVVPDRRCDHQPLTRLLNHNALFDVPRKHVDVINSHMKWNTTVYCYGLAYQPQFTFKLAIYVLQSYSNPPENRQLPLRANSIKSLLLLATPVRISIHIAGFKIEDSLHWLVHKPPIIAQVPNESSKSGCSFPVLPNSGRPSPKKKILA